MSRLSRAVLPLVALALSSCASVPPPGGLLADTGRYGTLSDGAFTVAAVDTSRIDPGLLRREVAFSGPYRPGTIVVNIPQRRLYLVQPGGTALRYAIGVGREEGLNFRGRAVIGRKEHWPTWTPTASMMRRIPHYRDYAGGLPGGPDNPLGARALYLYRGGQDTHFRLHGTNDPMTIGQAVSSGCIRLFNQDIIDLYSRVPLGTPLVVVNG